MSKRQMCLCHWWDSLPARGRRICVALSSDAESGHVQQRRISRTVGTMQSYQLVARGVEITVVVVAVAWDGNPHSHCYEVYDVVAMCPV